MNPISWRDQIKVHPAADLFPMMSDAELDELAADIAEHGLYQAIAFQGDELLDGRNRLAAIHRIKDETRRNNLLGFVASTKRVLEVRDPTAYVVSANLHRRQLSAEHKKRIAAELLKVEPQRSDRSVGKLVGLHHTTIATGVREPLERTGEISQLGKRVGADGKIRQQPSTKPPKPLGKEAQIRALREQKPVVVRPPAAGQPPTDDVDALQALLLTLRGDPRRVAGIPLDKRVTMARTCLAWLNLTPDDLRAP